MFDQPPDDYLPPEPKKKNNKGVDTKPRREKQTTKKRSFRIVPFLMILFAFTLITVLSSILGYQSGAVSKNATATTGMQVYLEDQLVRALVEIGEQNYGLARQRLDNILQIAPGHPGASNASMDLTVLESITATPTPFIPTPSPTADLRPAEELLKAAYSHTARQEWDAALDALAALRDTFPDYFPVQVDSLMYLSLRNRGAYQIIEEGNLESGLYDLAQAEKFGPLDVHANSYRVWARLYILGNSFWGAYPEQAAFYYQQVAAAVPGFSDSSGNSAHYRYWMSMVQIADASAAEENWCQAKSEYLTALDIYSTDNLGATATTIGYKCPTPTPTPSPTLTPTTKPTKRPRKPTKTPTPAHTPTSNPTP